jgi:hypothetical protein
MSQSYVNQLTINCLVNKEMINKHVDKKKLSKEEKEEIKFYRKRTYNLFKELINGTPPQDLLPDVKYAYDNFVKASIHYFKTADNNDIIQAEYDEFKKTFVEPVYDLSGNNNLGSVEADKLLMRSVKVNLPQTLDKHVSKTTVQKKEVDIFLPKQKEINLLDPKLQFKGLQSKMSEANREK